MLMRDIFLRIKQVVAQLQGMGNNYGVQIRIEKQS